MAAECEWPAWTAKQASRLMAQPAEKAARPPRSAFVRPHRPALAGTGPPCTMQWDGALPSPRRRSCLRRNGWGSQSSPRNSCVARPGGDGSHSSRGKSRAIGYRARWPHESFTKPWAEDRQTGTLPPLCLRDTKSGSDHLGEPNNFSYSDGIEAGRWTLPSSPAFKDGPVAQLDRVADFYSAGCRFESCRDRHVTENPLSFNSCAPFWLTGSGGEPTFVLEMNRAAALSARTIRLAASTSR